MVRPKKLPDGRAGNGGARAGTPGKTYQNRSDLRGATVKGQEYGAAKAQQESMAAVPMPQAQPPPAAPVGPRVISPDETPTLRGPSARPDEPITAGLPFGPGRNPSPFDSTGANAASDDVVDRLRSLYMAFPTPELRELLEQID